jgi:hypothetical protein
MTSRCWPAMTLLPTPLPAERRLLLEQLEAFHAEVRQRLS